MEDVTDFDFGCVNHFKSSISLSTSERISLQALMVSREKIVGIASWLKKQYHRLPFLVKPLIPKDPIE